MFACTSASKDASACTAGGTVWNTDANGATCGARILWLESKDGGGLSEVAAKDQVAKEYPTICADCAEATPSPAIPPCSPGGGVWNANANGATCGARILWLETKDGGSKSEFDAKNQVAAEYPQVCGKCFGTASPTPPTPAPTNGPTTSAPTPAPSHPGETNAPTSGSKSFWVFADLHMDPLYNSPNSYYHCCSEAHGNHCAGPFGQYGCDPPRALFESALAQAKKVDPDPEFIIFNGDLTGHNLGTPDLTLQTISDGYAMLRAAFPGKLIIPSIGNCETFPDYQIGCGADSKQYGISLKQLYDIWAPSLQGDQRAGPFQAGGYYYVHPSEGIRIIVLNTILYSLRGTHTTEDDPCGQFGWLEDQLKTADAAGETVYLISHVVPGVVSWENSDTTLQTAYSPFWLDKFWTRYKSLIIKYTDSIQAHAFGHAHRDYFRIMGEHPFNGTYPNPADIKIVFQELPALSPVRFNNPAFRRYFRKNIAPFEWENYEQYYLDLNEANAGKPTWRKEYNFGTDYNQPSLSANSHAKVYSNMQGDKALYTSWFNRRQSQAKVATIGTGAEFLYMCALTQMLPNDYNACVQKYGAPGFAATLTDFDATHFPNATRVAPSSSSALATGLGVAACVFAAIAAVALVVLHKRRRHAASTSSQVVEKLSP